MKKLFLIATMFSIGIFSYAYDWDGLAVPAPGSWSLNSVSDDFNYNSTGGNRPAAFTSRWTDWYINGFSGPSMTYYHRDHIWHNGSEMAVQAHFDAANNVIYTGCISSHNAFSYPLYIEAKVKLSGVFLANDIWMISADETQELDVCEAYPTTNPDWAWFDERAHISHHVFIRSPWQDWQPTDDGAWHTRGPGTTWRGEYHRWGMYWESPFLIHYYVDGVHVRTTPNNMIDPNNYTGGTGLNKPEHIIINMEQQSWHTDAGRFPNTEDINNDAAGLNIMWVDWIRVYNRTGTSSSSGGSSSGGSSSGGSSSGGSSSGGSSSGGTLQLTNVGESITLDVGQTFQLQYTGASSVHFNTNSGYANVDWNTGLITGAVLSNGNFATITVYDNNSTQTDAVKVYVEAGGSSSGSSSGGSSSGGTTNLALNKTATQSSNYSLSRFPASKAVDGNTSGTGNDFNHTQRDANAWWQVDLGSVSNITNIQVYNRTSCCQSRLQNFYVLVSDVPFTSTNLNTARNQSGVSDYHTAGTAGSPTTVNVNRSGRYVRVQLAGTNYLHIAEVKVNGTAGSGSSSSSGGSSSSGCTGSVITVEAESFATTGGTYNDGHVPLGANKSANSINWVNNGDWMDYTVNVPSAGTYSVAYQISSPITGSTIQITAGSSSNTTTVPNNGQWDSYTNLNASGTINLNAGSQTIRLAAGAQTWTWNLDKFTLTCAGKDAAESIASDITEISIYPNPVDDELNIILNGEINVGSQLMIYSSTGTLVHTATIDNNDFQLYTGDLSNGMYILKVINGSEVISKTFFRTSN